MVIKTYDKREAKVSIFNNDAKYDSQDIFGDMSPKSSSSHHNENIYSKARMSHNLEYDDVLIESKHKQRKVRSAVRRRRKQYKGNSCTAISFMTPFFDGGNSGANDNIFLSRKNSYERLFEKEPEKNDILIVGK